MLPTEKLKNEHREIERMLRIISRECDRIEGGGEVDREVFSEAADFFRDFADKWHHGKEERLLFEKLIERGMPKESGPIRVMLHEHDEGRAHVDRMAKLAAQKPSKRAAEELLVHAREYISLLSDHIRKEDGILYPIANDILTTTDQEELAKEFAVVESELMNPKDHKRYNLMIEKREKLPGRRHSG